MKLKTNEYKFLSVLRRIMTQNNIRPDRTGTGVKSIFGVDLRFSLENNKFPLLTTRKIPLRMVFEELMWFLRGKTDVRILQDKNVHVWDANTTREFLDNRGLHHYKVGDIGPGYGFQFRYSGAKYINCDSNYEHQGFDQLQYVINLLKTDPTSRRILINLWNPSDLDKMALVPCGFCYQFHVNDGMLSCKITQRSSDIALAGGWNIASASLLTYMLSHICNLKPKEVIWSVGDCHIYQNQFDGVVEQLKRTPRQCPTLHLINTSVKDITKFEYKDFVLHNYKPYPPIKLPLNA